MAAQPVFESDEDIIKRALQEAFDESPGPSHVFLERAEGRYYRAYIVNDDFAGMHATKRQDHAWEVLKVAPQLLGRIFSVYHYTFTEYKQEVMEQ